MSAVLRRKHLAAGAYFIWRCHHQNGQQDRAGDRNDGPSQQECEVELRPDPDYGHRKHIAAIETAEAMAEFHAAVDRVEKALTAIRNDLRGTP